MVIHFTADTCHTVSGPYEWRGGMNSIATTLTTSNTINAATLTSSILAGSWNKIKDEGLNNAYSRWWRKYIIWNWGTV